MSMFSEITLDLVKERIKKLYPDVNALEHSNQYYVDAYVKGFEDALNKAVGELYT